MIHGVILSGDKPFVRLRFSASGRVSGSGASRGGDTMKSTLILVLMGLAMLRPAGSTVNARQAADDPDPSVVSRGEARGDGEPHPAPPAITDLVATLEGENWSGALRLAGGLTADLQEKIEAGLETTIEYRMTVGRRRPFLPDQVIVKHRIECVVRYDALTQQYTLTRRLDGELEETRVTGELEAMIDFMTVLRNIHLTPAAEVAGGGEYYLKAKSNFGLVWRFYLIPWQLDTDWLKVPLQASGGDALATRP